MNNKYLFTVFTPTYNRAHTLPRVYESLLKQPKELFEWLVVDDGSTDDTQALLEQLQKSAPFPMRVITQENGGKPKAHNAAVKVARGELTVILDSDDELVPDALNILADEWRILSEHERKNIAALFGHCITSSGELVGSRYPRNRIDGSYFSLWQNKIMVGEKLPCFRTDVLREFPFPERGAREHAFTGTIWMKIGEKYKTRCIDHVVRIFHIDPNDKVSLTQKNKRMDINAISKMEFQLSILNLWRAYWPKFLGRFILSAAQCSRFALHVKGWRKHLFANIENISGKILCIVMFPVGYFMWLLDVCFKVPKES